MSWLSIDFSNPNISETNASIQKLSKETKKNFESIIENFRLGKPETFQTSGTNGESKTYTFSQKQIEASVKQTTDYFQLRPGMSITSPLGLEFVAGKMNVYRCLYGNLKLNYLPPNQFKDRLNSIPFSNLITLVPNQFYALLKVDPALKNIEQILLGGGPVQKNLTIKQEVTTSIFHGFGMTEALTHFAMRELYPKTTSEYKTIGQFRIGIKDGQLEVTHPVILPEGLITDEIVEPTEDGFFWKGRANNMIKSGGIKFFPELIEQKLSRLFAEAYVIIGLPHPKFGEAITLFIEGPEKSIPKMAEFLSSYEVPKDIIYLNSFPRTTSGKIQRNKLLEKYAKHYENLD